MPNFKEVGRRIEEEVQKLRRFFETEVKPTTERTAIEVLRSVSKRLAELAEELEARAAREKK